MSGGASRGEGETAALVAGVQAQLQRLLLQLSDLEELREDIDQDEYDIVKADTLEEMREFEAQLERMRKGDVSLVDELGSVQLAIQAAVRQSFKTPEVIQAFALRQPAALRQRLAELRRDAKLNKLPKAAADAQQAEVLAALRRLGGEAGKLTPDEEALLAAHEGGALLEAVRDDGSVRAPVVRQAGTE